MIPHALAETVQNFSTWILPVIFAITLHEAAHGWMAWKLGDDTAKQQGRVSANPLVHVDPLGTLLLPGLLLLTGAAGLFGWAKPVPVTYSRLKPIRRGIILVSLAGPGSNFLMAILSALLLHLTPLLPALAGPWVQVTLLKMVQFNLVLGVFNLLPLPPFDGGRALSAALPRHLGYQLDQLERYTIPGVMIALLLLPMIGLDIFRYIIGIPVFFLQHGLFRLIGLL